MSTLGHRHMLLYNFRELPEPCIIEKLKKENIDCSIIQSGKLSVTAAKRANVHLHNLDSDFSILVYLTFTIVVPANHGGKERKSFVSVFLQFLQ